MKREFIVKKISGAHRAHRDGARKVAGRATRLTPEEMEERILQNLEVILEDPESIFFEIYSAWTGR